MEDIFEKLRNPGPILNGYFFKQQNIELGKMNKKFDLMISYA
jgi:hypothetical protein